MVEISPQAMELLRNEAIQQRPYTGTLGWLTGYPIFEADGRWYVEVPGEPRYNEEELTKLVGAGQLSVESIEELKDYLEKMEEEAEEERERKELRELLEKSQREDWDVT